MRSFALIVAVGLVGLFALPLALFPATAAQASATKLSVTVGVSPTGVLVFEPALILVPQTNITLNVTFRNNFTGATPQVHTFTINNADGEPIVDTGNVAPGSNVSVEFHINTMTNITFNGTSFTPEAGERGIRFHCVPHRLAGMTGEIALAGLAAPEGEKGVLLRAYWIGLIGIFATIFWIGISYFVIKSSSPRFTDHKDHMKKGFP